MWQKNCIVTEVQKEGLMMKDHCVFLESDKSKIALNLDRSLANLLLNLPPDRLQL